MSPKTMTIEALLAKAERTDNPHEAEAFMAKAESLMVKHGIDAAMLDSNRTAAERESIIRDQVVFTGAYSHVLLHGAYYVATAFSDSVKAYVHSKNASHRTLHLVGYESDVAAAKVLIASLQLQSKSALNSWWRTKPDFYDPWAGTSRLHQQFMARRSFIQGFFNAASIRLRAIRRDAVAEAGAGTDIVLADRSKMVSDWVAANMQTSRGRSRGLNGGAGGAAGRDAGNRADIGGARISAGGRAISRG